MSESNLNKSESMQWTAQQLEAIRHEGSSVLVSAGAGAGKTEVLARHCAELLGRSEQACEINELLVVTFTDAAAAQMRERIGRIIREMAEQRPADKHLARQAVRVPTAAISTIHSFCQTVLRQNFARAGLDPQFTIMDAEEALLVENAALEEVFEELYLDKGKDGKVFAELVDLYGGGDDGRLGRVVMKLSDFLTSLVAPETWSENARRWLGTVRGCAPPGPRGVRCPGQQL